MFSYSVSWGSNVSSLSLQFLISLFYHVCCYVVVYLSCVLFSLSAAWGSNVSSRALQFLISLFRLLSYSVSWGSNVSSMSL